MPNYKITIKGNFSYDESDRKRVAIAELELICAKNDLRIEVEQED